MKIPIGIHKDTDDIVLADELTEDQRGLKCQCLCPGCETELVARWGNKTTKHFAHHRRNDNDSCQETALHMLGKHVISQLEVISFQKYEIKPDAIFDILGIAHEPYAVSIFGVEPVLISSSQQEVTIGNIRTDVFSQVSYQQHNIDFNFEVKVWHKVDTEKHARIKALDINTIEIDISHLLKDNYFSFDSVKRALNDPDNQKFIHLSDSFINPLIVNTVSKVDKEVKERNQAVMSWVSRVSKSLNVTGYTLPSYKCEFVRIPDNKFGKSLLSKLPPAPKVNSLLRVTEFKHVDKLCFELALCSLKESKRLPVYLVDNYHNEWQVPDTNYDNYLKIDIKALSNKQTDFKALWGRNSRMEEYQRRCQSIIDKEFQFKSAAVDLKLEANLNYANELMANNKFLTSLNYQKIKNTALKFYWEMVDKGITRERLDILLDETIDPYGVYGCQPKLWQIILIRQMYWIDNIDIDVKFSASLLKRCGVDMVGPYKALSFQSKLLKFKNIEMPFNTSYKMLSLYLDHLMIVGFITKEFRGRYTKNDIYGEAYRLKAIKKPQSVG